MILSVFSYMEWEDLSNCHSVCKRFNECLERDSFWRSWFYCRNDKHIVEERDLIHLKVDWKWVSRCRPIEPSKSAVKTTFIQSSNQIRHLLEWPVLEVVMVNFTMANHMDSASLSLTMLNT